MWAHENSVLPVRNRPRRVAVLQQFLGTRCRMSRRICRSGWRTTSGWASGAFTSSTTAATRRSTRRSPNTSPAASSSAKPITPDYCTVRPGLSSAVTLECVTCAGNMKSFATLPVTLPLLSSSRCQPSLRFGFYALSAQFVRQHAGSSVASAAGEAHGPLSQLTSRGVCTRANNRRVSRHSAILRSVSLSVLVGIESTQWLKR